MVCEFFDRKIAGGADKYEIMQNKKLAEELNKTIWKFENRKVYSSFTDNIWDADLTDMQLLSRFD